MSIPAAHVRELIIQQLSQREMRLLSLVVAIRKTFSGSVGFKGDLTAMIKSALRGLINSKMVVDVEGVYTLATPLLIHN
jgi:hypothetical protein